MGAGTVAGGGPSGLVAARVGVAGMVAMAVPLSSGDEAPADADADADAGLGGTAAMP